MVKIPKVIKIISYCGIIPFLLGVIGTFKFSLFHPYLNTFLVETSILYSALILSFLGGCLFGFECLNRSGPNIFRSWIAILPSLWALIGLQIEDFSATILIVGFLLVYEVDRRAHVSQIVPDWWLSLRFPLTVTVIISLSIIGFHHES